MTHANEQNLALWKQVEKTPTSATKNVNRNGQQITAIDAYHLIHLATKQFGPIGIGWGFSVVDERFDDGAPVFDGKGNLQGMEKIHTVRLRLWYEFNGNRGEVEQYGHTRAVYRTNRGTWMADEDAAKKSTTDAMKKALSLLGFSADVFTGKFDDEAYVLERRTETAIEQADDQTAAINEARDEFKAWLDKQCHAFTQIPHPVSIDKLLPVMLQQLPNRASIARMDEAATAAAQRRLEKAAAEARQALIEARQEAKGQESISSEETQS